MKTHFKLIFLISILFSCEQVENKDSFRDYEKTLTTHFAHINLMDNQSFTFDCLVYDQGIIYILDEHLLKIFSYSNQKGNMEEIDVVDIDSRIVDQIEGNELGFTKTNSGFIIINRSNIYHVTEKGELLFSYNLYNKGINSDIGGLPLVSTNNPVIIDKDDLFLTVYPDINAFEKESIEKAFAVMKFSKDSDISTFFKYPNVYRDNIFGYNYFNHYSTLKKNSDELLLSFPASDSLFFFNLKNFKIRSVKASSPYLNTVPAWLTPVNEYNAYTKYFATNPSYSFVKYDPNKNIYYRFAEEAINIDAYNAGKGWKDKHLLIFDQEFNLIDTLNITDSHLPGTSFITEKGLMIGRFLSEDKIGFDLLEVNPKIDSIK